ncbi:MAG: hypothetical protein GY694_03900 [Gammaproteobacteria bacterium]|nr:hypothetical protein [Gammaproteobacteria bacterium]
MQIEDDAAQASFVTDNTLEATELSDLLEQQGSIESSLLGQEIPDFVVEDNKKGATLNRTESFLDELTQEQELKQIKQDLLKEKYGSVNNNKIRPAIKPSGNGTGAEVKLDSLMDSLAEDFDMEEVTDKVIEKVKNKSEKIFFSSDANMGSKGTVLNEQYAEPSKNYSPDDDINRVEFNKTFKWTIIYLIIGLVVLKLFTKIYSIISSKKKKHRRRRHK